MEVRVPATLVDCKLPRLVKSYDEYVLDKKISELSDLVDREFQSSTDGKLKNPNGKIPGWNGGYLSAIDWRGGLKLKDVDFNSIRYFFLDIEPVLRILPVKVSDDLASSHFYVNRDGNQNNNPICCLGSYVVPVVLDKSGNVILLVARRPDNAFLYTGRFDATGVVVSENSDGFKYISETVSRVESKYKIKIGQRKIKSLGIIRDNVTNYLILSGWTFITEEDVLRDCGLRSVAIKDFQVFIRKEAPIERWNYPAFVALCETIYKIGETINDSDLKNLGRGVIAEQYGKLRNKPIDERTVLQNLGVV